MRQLTIYGFLLLFCTGWSASGDKEKAELYVIDDGFMFAPENYSDKEIFEGGAWSLYYMLEQEVTVRPGIRRFLSGTQTLLFKIAFDQEGKFSGIETVERYYWYTIDGLARSLVDEFIRVLSLSGQWKNNFSGELYLPLRFRVSGGRIMMDYNTFVTGGVGKVRVGKK